MDAIEPLKDVRLISIRNSRPIIRKHDFNIRTDTSAPYTNCDLIGGRVTQRVFQQILKDLLDPIRIDIGKCRIRSPIQR